jgi:hypothetical protein
MRAIKNLCALAAVGVLSGCAINAPLYTLSGTISLTNLNATDNATVIVQGSNYYTTSIVVPPADSNGMQSFTYSFSGVASGVYTISVTVNAPAMNSSYYVLNNSGVQIAVDPIKFEHVWWTITTENVILNSNLLIDFGMQ